MAEEVVVTRRGQTTIPMEIRRRLRIEEGTRMKVEARNGAVVFTKLPSFFDFAGTLKMSRAESSRMLDRIREEE